MTKQFEALRAVHRQRFIAGAHARVSRGLELVQARPGNHAVDVLEELRALAGEASLLGLDSLAAVARAGADAARLWAEQGSASAVRVCERSLETLADTISLVTAAGTGDYSRSAEALLAKRRAGSSS